MPREQETDGDDRGTCGWCREENVELEDADLADSFTAAHHGPEDKPGQGTCIKIPYGAFCESCFNSIREEWEENGSVTRPATAWGLSA